MPLSEMNSFIQALLWVSIGFLGTMAEEPECTPRYFEELILEKVKSLDLKSNMALDRLDKLIDLQDNTKKPAVRSALHPFNDAIRIEDLEYDGWQMVFRATSGNGHNVYQAWTKGRDTCENKPETMERSNDCHYRNPVVSEWKALNVKMAKFALYSRDMEVAYIIFDGEGSDSMNWFAKSRVISSSWFDLTPSNSFNYFSIRGHVEKIDRRFFINRSYGGCSNDLGHVTVLDTTVTEAVCEWDRQPNYPQFLYSQINSVDIMSSMQLGRAEYMAVFIKIA